MARLREADLNVGDRLRYYEPEGAHYRGRIVSIERTHGLPAVVLFAVEDGAQLILRLGKLARNSTRIREAVA